MITGDYIIAALYVCMNNHHCYSNVSRKNSLVLTMRYQKLQTCGCVRYQLSIDINYV